jgi:hypothetical protein
MFVKGRVELEVKGGIVQARVSKICNLFLITLLNPIHHASPLKKSARIASGFLQQMLAARRTSTRYHNAYTSHVRCEKASCTYLTAHRRVTKQDGHQTSYDFCWRQGRSIVMAEEVEYSIKPENVTPAIPTSEWPLLLKNYDKREIPGFFILIHG